MILYWFLLLLIAVVAYGIGSMSTMVIASNFVFRTSLSSLGRGDIWLSNFRRIYGVWGMIRLLLTELIKDALPILFGALLLGFKGHADVGRAFAGFCLVLGAGGDSSEPVRGARHACGHGRGRGRVPAACG